MGFVYVRTMIRGFILFCAVVCILHPVSADNGTLTVAYRGSGGGYIGDTVIFDGKDTDGTTVLLKISGPGLPAEGVPINNLNGPTGTGTPVEVDQYGAWKFAWYSSIVPGIEKLKTARYTITATDSADPLRSSSAFYMLKKPEYSLTASPDPVNPGHYLELIGNAEQGISTAKIEIKDTSGNVLHTFTSPVSSSGYFNYGFHVDMAPGQYPVTVSNPVLKAPFGTVISVVPEEGILPVTTSVTREPVATVPTTEVISSTIAAPVSATSPAESPVTPLTIIAALACGILLLRRFRDP